MGGGKGDGDGGLEGVYPQASSAFFYRNGCQTLLAISTRVVAVGEPSPILPNLDRRCPMPHKFLCTLQRQEPDESKSS